MKKIIYIISSVCLLAGTTSCDKNLVDSTEVKTDLMTLSASVEDNAEVKTVLNNEKNKSHWCKEDQLSIFDGTNHRQFSIKDKASYESAATAEFEGETLADASAYMALYPYTSTATFEGTTIKNAVLPNTQTLETEGTFADGAALSVAYSTVKSSYSFKNVATVISFTLNQNASSVEFIANGGENIAGTIDISYNGIEDPTYTVQSGKGYDTVTVTGDFKSGSTYYFTILPDVTFSAGYTFKINGYTAKTGAVGKKLERSTIYNISGDLKLTASNWYIKGTFNNFGITTRMYEENGLLVAKNVDLSTENVRKGFKFSYDGISSWGTVVGAAGKDEDQVEVSTGSWYLAKQNRHNDYNGDICLSDYTKKYDIYLEPSHYDFYIVEAGADAPCSIVVSGDCNGWAETRMEYVDGFFVAKNMTFAANQAFKFKKSGSWDVAFAIAPWDESQPIKTDTMTPTIPGGSGNIKIQEAGSYDIYIKSDYTFCYIVNTGETPHLNIPGEVEVTVYCKNNDAFEDRANLWAWSVIDGTGHNWSSEWPGEEKSSESHWIAGNEYFKWTYNMPSERLGKEVRLIFTKNGENNTPKDGSEDSFILHAGMIMNIYEDKLYSDCKALF